MGRRNTSSSPSGRTLEDTSMRRISYVRTVLPFGCIRRAEFDIVCMQWLQMDKVIRREPKKPYSKPTLTTYGTVRELTQSVGTHGSFDGTLVLRTHM
jgi:hypothetical protein